MWFKNLRADIKAAKNNDPAARNSFEIEFKRTCVNFSDAQTQLTQASKTKTTAKRFFITI